MFARTEHLLLRPAWAEDAPALFRAIADERVVRNLATAPWPYLPEHAQSWTQSSRPADRPAALIFRRSFLSFPAWRGAVVGAACGFGGAIGIHAHCSVETASHVTRTLRAVWRAMRDDGRPGSHIPSPGMRPWLR